MPGGSGLVALSAAAFVGSHLALSHPLRRPLVRRLGEGGFAGLYSAVAADTLGATGWAYRRAPVTPPLWQVGDTLWAIATAAMLIAAILLMGSLSRNPALPGAGATAGRAEARDVYAVTRHPMLWSFAIWGIVHVLIFPVAKNIVVAVAVILLSLLGAALQDAKKGALDPEGWGAWQQRTSYLPFAAIASGRARLGGFRLHTLAGGVIIWLGATWAHLPLAGWPAGIWRWVG